MPSATPAELPDPWRRFLGDVDGLLPIRVQLHCLGGFVMAVKHRLPRTTSDVDYIEVVPHDAIETLQRIAGRSPACPSRTPDDSPSYCPEHSRTCDSWRSRLTTSLCRSWPGTIQSTARTSRTWPERSRCAPTCSGSAIAKSSGRSSSATPRSTIARWTCGSRRTCGECGDLGSTRPVTQPPSAHPPPVPRPPPRGVTDPASRPAVTARADPPTRARSAPRSRARR